MLAYLVPLLSIPVITCCLCLSGNDLLAQQPTQLWQVIPKSVYDGDTFRVRRGGQTLKIRMCGIDAPELQQPLGVESRNHLRSLLNQSGNRVQIEPVEKDKYGRTVAEVFRQNNGHLVNVNAEMTQTGWAYLYARYARDCPSRGEIASGEQQAKQQRLGVWKNQSSIPPWEWRKQHP